MSLLPGRLSAALAGLAEGKARVNLSSRSRAITRTYQDRRNSASALFSADDALAYALARMPATFGATKASLEKLAESDPSFAPVSLLDIGCGPGTASFAAAEAFPSLQRFELMDRNGPFLDLARHLAGVVLEPMATRVSACDLDQAGQFSITDLVVASYVLAELSARSQAQLIQRLWQATGQALLLVEPGTPDGHARLIQARQALLSAGAHIAAPCTHAAACPLSGERWCRFFARVQRSRDHRFLKGGEKPFEDEPYAYLAVMRRRVPISASHRIVGRPAESKAAISLELCGAAGLETFTAPSRERKIFKQVKRMRWGDAVVIPIQAPHAQD